MYFFNFTDIGFIVLEPMAERMYAVAYPLKFLLPTLPISTFTYAYFSGVRFRRTPPLGGPLECTFLNDARVARYVLSLEGLASATVSR